MATADEALRAQVRNIEATYGRPLPEWFAIIAASGRTKHTDVVALLKNEYGMTHGAAHRVSLLSRQAAAPGLDDTGASPVDTLYSGKKAVLRPLHDALVDTVNSFGDDVDIVPKKGYLSLRRRKQFAMIQPSTTGRLDVGLIVKDLPTNDRLESAGGFNALFTHRIRLTTAAEIDAELTGWLKSAYDQAG
jgi:Domain of unknown function (DUF5655)/Domain of unknown function (DUF4287)